MAAPAIQAISTVQVNNSATYDIAKPTGTVNGDLLIWTAQLFPAARVLTVDPPTGWTTLTAKQVNGNMVVYTFYKIASSEPATITMTANGSSFGGATMLRISGYNGGIVSTVVSGTGTSYAPSSAPASAPTLAIVDLIVGADVTFTPSGTTLYNNTLYTASGYDSFIGQADRVDVSTYAPTVSFASNIYVGQLIFVPGVPVGATSIKGGGSQIPAGVYW